VAIPPIAVSGGNSKLKYAIFKKIMKHKNKSVPISE
jgi:hypothetical protein